LCGRTPTISFSLFSHLPRLLFPFFFGQFLSSPRPTALNPRFDLLWATPSAFFFPPSDPRVRFSPPGFSRVAFFHRLLLFDPLSLVPFLSIFKVDCWVFLAHPFDFFRAAHSCHLLRTFSISFPIPEPTVAFKLFFLEGSPLLLLANALYGSIIELPTPPLFKSSSTRIARPFFSTLLMRTPLSVVFFSRLTRRKSFFYRFEFSKAIFGLKRLGPHSPTFFCFRGSILFF